MIRSPLREDIRETISLAVPAVLAQLGLALMGVVDSAIVGRLGRVALDGVALGGNVFFTVLVFALGTIMAVDPLVAQAFGAGRRGRCGAILSQGIWLALAFSLPLTALFLHFRPVLDLFGEPPTIAAAASEYVRARAWHVPTFLLFGALRGFLNGVGNTRAVMKVAIAGNIVNAGVVYALVYGLYGIPALGIRGAGYGSSIAGAFMAGATALVVGRKRYAELEVRLGRPDAHLLGEIVRIGAPIGGQITAEVAVFGAVGLVMGRLGEAPLAAHQIALQLASVTFMVPLGISIAASVRVGQAVGRRSFDDAFRAGRAAYLLGVGFMLLTATAFAAIPEALARIFTKDPTVLPLAVGLIRIAGIFQLSDGAQAVGAGCLRGVNDSRAAFVVNVIAHWGVGFPIGYALGVRGGLGANGLWYGLTASLTLVAILLAVRFRSGRWRGALEEAPCHDAPQLAQHEPA